MCGIAGFAGRYDPSLLGRMNQVLGHRGPDDVGAYFDPVHGIGLAHRRLSIIDLSPQGHQPMWDTTRTAVTVFNGEIYNYRELRDELIRDGVRFAGGSDTEVLVNLYLRDGERMLSRLNGIFAFAIWDTRSRTLFLARDGVGVKPLYYAETPSGFLFASELKALLCTQEVDRRLNEMALMHHLTYLWCPAPHTMVAAVKKLEPGHTLAVQDGKISRSSRFYDLPYDQPIECMSEADAVSRVRDALQLAVSRQMVADVPVGAFLSGGLDSSAVVRFAKDHALRDRLQCFTIGFRDDAASREGMTADLPYAQRVAKHLGVDLHTVEVGPEMADHLETMIYHLDEPQADPAPLNVLLISQLARQHGIKVLLSGAGGDDIFSGYRRHLALLQECYWAWLPRTARRGLSWASQLFPGSSPLGRRLGKAFRYADLAGDERLVSYFYWSAPSTIRSLYGPGLRAALGNSIPAEPLIATLRDLPPNTPPLNRMLYLEGKYFLPDHNLNYTDKMGMAAGVEIRVPLLDPDLISLATRLPTRFKQRGRTGKWIFKQAMEPDLPRDVIYRPKTGFGAPLRSWLRNELHELVEDVLSETSLKRRGLFDPAGVHTLIRQDRQGQIDGTYTIFSLVCMELWCRIFLDGKQLAVH
jgi:asparagine synthase (glutamine-hydrolysing)